MFPTDRFRQLVATLVLAWPLAAAEPPSEDRIVFLGDSITQAGGYVEIIEAALIAHEPTRKRQVIRLGLASETVSGLSEPGHAGGQFPRPTLHERLDRVLEKSKPQLVLACYGMNDGIYHPLSDDRTKAFQDGIATLRAKVAAAGARLIHLTPPVFDPVPIKDHVLPAGRDVYTQPYEGYNTVLDAYSAWLVARRADGWEVIDIHGPMNDALAARRRAEPQFTFAGDGVHAGEEGHLLMARAVLDAWGLKVKDDGTPDHPQGAGILAAVRGKQAVLAPAWLSHVGHLRPGIAPGLPLAEAEAKAAEFDAEARRLASEKPAPLPGKTSDWNGFRRHDFEIAGRSVKEAAPVIVVAPAAPAPGRPWVWHGEFFGHKPAPDIALLGRGFHIVQFQVPDMLGSPPAVALWNRCYEELTTRHGFSAKPALVGLSRGGLYCYNWAIANPDKVSCLYADAAVCDFKSWPGGKGKGKGDPGNWALVLKLWNFPDEAAALAYQGNPVDSLAPLAERKVPLLHVFGDADDVVPWEENTGLVAERYEKLGGPITLIRKPGVGHHPHGLDDPAPIVEFIARHAAGR
jgi:lysophospholipase L1-like esterase/pimeloyl-ACP methyl ester carboxylesterase